MRALLKKLGLSALRAVCGVNLVDQRTGEKLGRVVVVRWRGRLMMIGFDGAAVYPHFMPQARETYWGQELGFSTHPPPDFPHVADSHRSHHPPESAGSGGHG